MGHEYVKEPEVFSTLRNGTVPKPTAGDVSANKFLRADGTWASGGGGGGASEFADLDDVSFSNIQNGQIPKYNSTTQKWENANESGGGGSVNDVEVNGTSVVNQGVAEITSYTELTQAQYDLLPASKLTDNVMYCIKDGGNAIAAAFYHFSAFVWNSRDGVIQGRGSVSVTLTGGIARIDFDVVITTGGTGASVWAHGINANLLKTAEPNLPTITPVKSGYWVNSYSSPSIDYGSVFEPNGEFWCPARYYDSGNVSASGGWAENQFPTGRRIYGCCFGTY